MDRAALFTAGLALASLTAGAFTGVALSALAGQGFATLFIAFIESASKATQIAPEASLVPNVAEQVVEASKTLQEIAVGGRQPPPRPSEPFLALGILLSNLRVIALIPALHAALPLGMALEGRGRMRLLGVRHERAIMASALAPLLVNGFAMGGSVSEYPDVAPLIALEALALSIASYIASKALLSNARGLERLRGAYSGSLGVFTSSILVLALASGLEAHNIIRAGGWYGG